MRPKRSLVPRSMASLSNEMILKHLLREIYDIDYSHVRTVSVKEKGCKPGDITGNLSESGRVVVTIVMNDGTKRAHHWFVKIMSKQHRNIDLMDKFNIFENEIGFYKDIAPDLLSFLNNNGLGDVEFDIPTLLFSARDEEGAVIILEDISELGYTQERDEQGGRYLSLEKAQLAIHAIARIQAASKLYNMHREERLEDRHATLRRTSMWMDDDFLDRLTAMEESFCQVLRKSSEQDSDQLLKRFQSTFDSGDKLKLVCAERYAPKDTCAEYLQHGDFHYNNLLFKEDKDEGMKVMVVDWQLTYTGRSTGDLSYLLLSSISPDDRHAHEQELKDTYFDCFNGYLKAFEASVLGDNMSVSEDSDSDVEVDVEDLEQDYQDSAPLSLFLSCGNVLSTDVDREASPDIPEDAWEQATVTFAYSLVKEAAEMNII